MSFLYFLFLFTSYYFLLLPSPHASRLTLPTSSFLIFYFQPHNHTPHTSCLLPLRSAPCAFSSLLIPHTSLLIPYFLLPTSSFLNSLLLLHTSYLTPQYFLLPTSPSSLNFTRKYFPTFFTFCHTNSLAQGKGLSLHLWG